MKRLLLLVTALFLLGSNASAGPIVEMKTSMGTIQIELNEEKAPVTVKNFLNYVDEKFYDGTIFHRVIRNFMIQGGGFDKSEHQKRPHDPIKNEATNGLKNRKGTIAMARTNVVDSATSQFFINLADNDFLNHSGTAPQRYGYAVFGQVVSGMDVVEKIGDIKTVAHYPMFKDYPQPQVIIESVRLLEKQN
jgi:cyclophilin family peptidyl-prolyl cis-trans isomerase